MRDAGWAAWDFFNLPNRLFLLGGGRIGVSPNFEGQNRDKKTSTYL
jgi:hypothetical protein